MGHDRGSGALQSQIAPGMIAVAMGITPSFPTSTATLLPYECRDTRPAVCGISGAAHGEAEQTYPKQVMNAHRVPPSCSRSPQAVP